MNKFYFEKIDIRTIILHKVLKHIHNSKAHGSSFAKDSHDILDNIDSSISLSKFSYDIDLPITFIKLIYFTYNKIANIIKL